jgi:glycosyltransferase involved in cell wall biosynthesis
MPIERSLPIPIRVHLTNVAGAGASQLVLSLLPALQRCKELLVSEIHLPDRGPLASFAPTSAVTKVFRIKRKLPNALSRFVECLWSSRYLSGAEPLLVLGDLPLRCQAPQTVLVQTPNVLVPLKQTWSIPELKYVASRWIFRVNAKYASTFIVQTEWMRESLASSYPSIADRIHVLAQPVPQWMMGTPLAARPPVQKKLRLVYPSAGYPHKNHQLLSLIGSQDAANWPVESLQLTLPSQSNPAADVSWINCVGFLNPAEMIAAYQNAHAMVFLSLKESFGFPLLEAMYLGLPIVCADLPYAHALCSNGAIYFDPTSVQSLKDAIEELHLRLQKGWVPDWTAQLQKFPEDWSEVATRMAKIVGTIK